ncbi:hypothetical protein O9H85_11905 [Paenibacillus filicis]|uniref:Uncharacterized protein n=1 Tax=Paenibacillus gyeongsangnamensis TaxID=3388067 RepID=A0ABT4Q8A2_9BACL|nr:hypothetical protein [Paenibacillus filicis]MCZ8513114.1 hypothetical protein [Paenibacillus filicis]
MSRKWERMVKKNTKVTNARRKKSGSNPISGGVADDSSVFKGRSWLWPLLLVAIGFFCFVAFRSAARQDNLYWVTGASYIFLAVLIYWARRPYLKVGKQSLTSRRFSGERTVEAAQISEIAFSKDAVVIIVQPKNSRWVFTRFYHQFPLEPVKAALKEFANKNAIALKEE